MLTLFTDIDNTLIYSHRHPPQTERCVAEWLNGAEQSYITRRTLDCLSAMRGLRIVPVTTRTIPQYLRLRELLRALHSPLALVCNGALLLRDGEIDPNWREESLRLAAGQLPELSRAESWLRRRCGESAVHGGEGMLVYAGTDSPAALGRELARELEGDGLELLWDQRKLYCIPRAFNKGAALRRFRERFPVELSVAAGDSDFDLPMLEQADWAVLPPELAPRLRAGRARIAGGEGCFSDRLCTILEEMTALQEGE